MDLKEQCLNDLRLNYTQPGHPIAFSGIQNIYKYYNGTLKIKDIQSVLQNFETYTINREVHEKSDRNPSYSHFKGYQWQMDLVDIQALSKYNDGNRYILTVIDTFTRYAFCRLVTFKTASLVLKAFKSILKEANRKPLVIVLDGGAEFRNKHFKAFCQSLGIDLYAPDTSTHGAYIERFNRTLQSLIYKYMHEKNTYRFVEVFQDLVETYNFRKHRMIGFTPYQAENDPRTHLKIRLNMSKYYEKIKEKKVVFKIGDKVRISKLRTKFRRGYKEQFNQEIFKIYKISSHKKIPLYYLTNYEENDKVTGGFYAFELSKVDNEVFNIEKILDQRQNDQGETELLVKWDGLSESSNSWVKKSEIQIVHI
jgi:hypothetical protein